MSEKSDSESTLITTRDVYNRVVERVDPESFGDNPRLAISILKAVAEVFTEILAELMPPRDEDLGPGDIRFTFPDGNRVTARCRYEEDDDPDPDPDETRWVLPLGNGNRMVVDLEHDRIETDDGGEP